MWEDHNPEDDRRIGNRDRRGNLAARGDDEGDATIQALDEETFARLQYLGNVGDATETYSRMWTEIKTEYDKVSNL